MDLDLFVQCAARTTAMDGLSFQGLRFLVFIVFSFVLLNSKTNMSLFLNLSIQNG